MPATLRPVVRLSRRRLLAGTGALLAGGLLGAGPAAVAGADDALPWSRRLWGYLSVADDVALRYSVLLPEGPGPFPVLVQYSGYDSGTIGGASYRAGNTWLSEAVDASLLRAGYAVLGVSMRGTSCSSGLFDLFGSTWGSDGAQAVEWAAGQPWSTGRVGMYDWSWAGLSQLFVAAERPEGLCAIAPGMVVTDPLRDVGAPGGVANVEFPALWWATILDSWTYAEANAQSDQDTVGLENLTVNAVVGQFDSPVTSSGHPFEDAYWAARDLRARCARIVTPVLSVEDWQDEEVGPRGGYYQELLNPATTWFVGTNGQHDIYVNELLGAQRIAFFDHFVKGLDNGFESSPRVQLWLETSAPGAPESSDAELAAARPSWVVTRPSLPVGVLPARLYLRADGTLTQGVPPLGRSTYAALPGPVVNDGVVAAISGGPGGPLGEQTWGSGLLVAGGYAAFTTPPVPATVTLCGSASLDLWISSLSPATQVQVTVTEVRPDGQEVFVQRGWLDLLQRALSPALARPLRPVHLQTLSSVAPLEPGAPVSARVEINKFTHTFRSGSSLRVIVDAPSGTGDWNFAGVSPAVNTIWCGGARASSLLVGLLSVEPAPVGYPAPGTLVGQPCRRNAIAVPSSEVA